MLKWRLPRKLDQPAESAFKTESESEVISPPATAAAAAATAATAAMTESPPFIFLLFLSSASPSSPLKLHRPTSLRSGSTVSKLRSGRGLSSVARPLPTRLRVAAPTAREARLSSSGLSRVRSTLDLASVALRFTFGRELELLSSGPPALPELPSARSRLAHVGSRRADPSFALSVQLSPALDGDGASSPDRLRFERARFGSVELRSGRSQPDLASFKLRHLRSATSVLLRAQFGFRFKLSGRAALGPSARRPLAS